MKKKPVGINKRSHVYKISKWLMIQAETRMRMRGRNIRLSSVFMAMYMRGSAQKEKNIK